MGQRDRARSFLPGLPLCPVSRNWGLPGPVCLFPGGPAWQAEAQGHGRAALEGRRNFDRRDCPTAAADTLEKEKISHEALLHPERES